MNEEEKIRLETEKLLDSLEREQLIDKAIIEYKSNNQSNIVSKVNSQAQIEGSFKVVRLRDEQYNIMATYRVFNDKLKRVDS